ncbi:MAG: cytochrome-c oxidase [Planctomycetota bacterium]|nr:MAG: cytochrome-c oxidase [Planctomycetota bacterium]
MSDHHEVEEQHHEPTYGTPIIVFLGLVAFTCITVASSSLNLTRSASVILAMVIATMKASLVLYFFMHLKYEKPYFKVFLFIAVLTLSVVFMWTFLDYPFRLYN